MSALLLIDIQYDFLPPNGTLAVPDGLSILPSVHSLLSLCSPSPNTTSSVTNENSKRFRLLALSQDWHPPGHVSFASTHALAPFTAVQLPASLQKTDAERESLTQMLWPDHCVQGSRGAEVEESVVAKVKEVEGASGNGLKVVRVKKGYVKERDAYSAFEGTKLDVQLKEHGIKKLFLAGLATDYCIRATALSGVNHGYEVYVVEEGVRGVAEETSATAVEEMKAASVKFIKLEEVQGLLL
ncbi:Isochorismatase hydrolase [Atractiella rhizophila]|nr:Isochorismatase hydrolase [Atractiella rhizophila]